MKIYKIIIITIFTLSIIGFANGNEKDSINNKINNAKDLKEKIKLYIIEINKITNKNPYKAELYIKEAIELCEKNNYKNDFGELYRLYSLIKFYQTNYSESLDLADSSLYYCKINNDKKGQAKAYNMFGLCYSEYGDNEKTMYYYNLALDLRREINDYDGVASSLNNIGVQFMNFDDLNNALKFYNEALKIAQKYNSDNESIALYYDNIGEIKLLKGEFKSAYISFNKSLEIRKKTNNPQWLANSYRSIGDYFFAIDDYKQAIYNYEKSLTYADSTKILYEINSALSGLRVCYEKIKDYEKAYFYFNRYKEVSDMLQNNDLAEKVTKIELKLQFEKQKQIDDLIIEKKNIETRQAIEKQRLIRNFSWFVIILFLIIIIIIIYRNFRIKKKDNVILKKQKEEIQEKNSEIIQRNEEILAQRDEIESQRDAIILQKEQIEQIHTELKSSILYAKKLQNAIIPSSQYLDSILNEYFIIYKPVQIISGDFYWLSKVKDTLIIAVADCTGHGVPGAFMSMLGISFLNEIVRKQEITKANQVLSQLRIEIINALHQKGESGEQKDGMDISLIAISQFEDETISQLEESNKDNFQISKSNNRQIYHAQWAGANNPLYIVSNYGLQLNSLENNTSTNKHINTQMHQLYEIKGDKMPIAIYERMDNFTNHEFELHSGDMIYLFTDGYADQFGGEKGKKFMYKNFKEMILSNSDKTMKEQQEIYEEKLQNWIGNGEQIDDITVLGLKIN